MCKVNLRFSCSTSDVIVIATLSWGGVLIVKLFLNKMQRPRLNLWAHISSWGTHPELHIRHVSKSSTTSPLTHSRSSNSLGHFHSLCALQRSSTSSLSGPCSQMNLGMRFDSPTCWRHHALVAREAACAHAPHIEHMVPTAHAPQHSR